MKEDVVFIFLNVIDTVNGIYTVENNDFIVSGAFFHGVDFASEEVGKFVGMSTALESRFIVHFIKSIKKDHGDRGDFISGILVKNGRSNELPNFGNVFSFNDFLTVNDMGDSNGAFGNLAEFEKSSAVYRLQFFIELAFGFEMAFCRIRI